MSEKPFVGEGLRNALLPIMKIPFLIFLVSGLATLQLEPLATHGIELASAYAARQTKAHTQAGKLIHAGDEKILCLKQQLADVQMDLMKVFETDRAATMRLESREAGLKYALRAEQLRQDEMAECLKKQQPAQQQLQAASRCLISSQTPQS